MQGSHHHYIDSTFIFLLPHPTFSAIKIYPVVILGKAALGWDLAYMCSHWRRVFALGVLPWAAELSTVTVCTNVFLGFPCFWGVILGSIYASVSCAVLTPLMRRWKDGMSKVNWTQLVCTAGGTDTALSVGVCGLLLSYEFHVAENVYRYVKASLTLFAGVGLGAAWGGLAYYIPHNLDVYVSELRVMYVLLGGLFFTFITLLLGWGGTGGVAVLACNSMAARQWARAGWALGSNPVATAYRVLWDVLEPMLFTYTGTYFVINKHTGETLLVGLAVLVISVTVRLTVATLVCWDFTLKEKVYLCCTWIPKTIVEDIMIELEELIFTRCVQYNARNSASVKSVTKASQWRKIETQGRRRKGRRMLNLRITSIAGNSELQNFAVLCPVMLIALPPHRRSAEARYAEDIISLTIQAIFITTLIGQHVLIQIAFPRHDGDSELKAFACFDVSFWITDKAQ
ncbi:hypothetical protein EVAR_46451_1 [Eumeta japonica]|uniref:Cation/H+ exchanger domain-containing protein n=1 Tax=Eumeta variegata TaxID=151549 RepID=A0A4C1XI09_EUMVA|nr:hypothetical protein EVAR_46451_1 [Eumeta japonica]